MTDDDGRREPDGVREGHHERLPRSRARSVACSGGSASPCSFLRQGEGADGVWQVRQYGLEGAPGVGHAVQKEYGNSPWVSLLDVEEAGLPPPSSHTTGHTVPYHGGW